MTRRKQAGLLFLVVVLFAFGVYDFWDGYRNHHSVAAGVLSVLGGVVSAIWCSGWPAKREDDPGPPVV